MTNRLLHPCFRLFASFTVILLALVLFSGLNEPLLAAGAPLQAASAPSGPRIWLDNGQTIPVTHVGAPTIAQSLSAGKGQPLSMTTGDFDEDGIADLLVGYNTPAGFAISVQRGNLDAFAPQSDASFQAIGHGQFPAPFLPSAQVFSIPISPDFLAAGNFTGKGHLDFVAAAKGGSALYVFAGDGKGGFAEPQTIDLNGAVTALAAGKFGNFQSFDSLVIGLSGPQNTSSLVHFAGSQQGLTQTTALALDGDASNILLGDFGDTGPDAAFLSGGQVVLLHSSSMQLEKLSLPVNPVAMALGWFIYDRNPNVQIALLTADGSVQIAAHNEFDPRVRTAEEMKAIRDAVLSQEPSPLIPKRSVAMNGWKVVESISSAAPFNPGQPPVFLQTRISNHGPDDLMVLNPSLGQMVVVLHPDPTPSAATFLPALISSRPYTGSPVAAISTRVNVDGRPGIVALHSGQVAPAVMMPLPDPTFFVNRTDDPVPTSPIANACNNVSFTDLSSSCSLREAVLKANGDTIMLQALTYTLSRPKVTNDFSGNNGALYVNHSVTIVGANQSTTIIQAGTTNANGVDMVMAVNEDINPITNATASISNLTMRFGNNQGTHGNDGDGGCMEFDTGSSGTANLSLTNVTLTDCTTHQGNGGGLVTFNFVVNGPGLATITNSIIQNNTVNETVGGPSGGGIFVSFPSRILMTNSQVINNNAIQLNGANRGLGGGLRIFSNVSGSRQTVIHASTISGNQASGPGGGIWNSANLLIDNAGGATVISGNAAGANGGGSQDGGGIFHNSISPDSMSLSKVTITGNTATGNGGGIFSGNLTGGGPATVSFSRLAGNTATGSGNNLNNVNSAITATNNWWGTNSPATTINNTSGGTTTFDPFIQLTHTANPAVIKINQSTTLTGDMSKDNHGVGTNLSGNLDVLNGLPITFNNPILGSIPQAQPEALNASAQATATFNAGGTSGTGHADAVVDQATVTANIVILEPLRIVKSFNSATVAVNASSTLTFSVNNPNVIAVDASFTDTFPAGLVVAATPAATNTCGGTFTATAGAGSVSFTNATLAVGTCTITVAVTSAADSVYNNSVTINSTAAGTGALSTSSASLTVINPPTIAKAFGAATIPLNGTTSLTFTLSSTNANLTLNGVAFTDNLPAGLVVATPGNLTSTCSGTATAVDGSGSISLSGASLAPGASCTISVNVTGTTAGVKNNSVQASSTNGGTGNTSNASITVVAPPVIIKAFGAASIPLNGSTSLTFTIQNNNTTVSLTGIGFSDTLPAGLVISTPNGLTGTCGGGTITATAGTNVISLSGGSIAASSSCTFSVNVTGTAAGTQNNTTGNVTSTEGGTGGTASASVDVVAPPSIAKVFNPSTIALNATTSLTFTITNPAANAVSLTGVAFTDTLPTGLTVANASATVCGGTLTTTAPTGIALSGATIAINSQCQFSVTVTGAASGQYTNTTGSVTSTNGGTGNTATANLTVAIPPTITKAFGAASIPLNGTTSLTFTINNPNTGLGLTGLAFTDNLPAGLVIATTPNLNNTCGGTATAVGGSGSVSLSGGTVAASASCTVSVNVTGTTAGVKNNSVQVTSTEGGTGNTSNASITVVGPPVIIKAFGAASIPLNGSTSLTFTIQNNNTTTTLTGIGFSDTLPAGLVISTPNGLTGTCGGGTITATQATSVISLSGATLAQSSSCTFSVNVTGTAAGTQNNTTGNVTSTEGGTGGTASASINVVGPPSIAKVFTPSAIALNATTSLTFTITNPAANAVSLTGVAFTDTLPTGLTVANASATVCGGTLTTTAPTGIALSGATIAANSQCQFSVTVTGAAAGNYTNTTGNVTSTNGGTGNTASANLTVAIPPTITKAFGAASIPLNGSASLTFNINNPNTNLTLTGVAFTDNLPAGLVVATPNGLTSTCGGAATAVAGSGSISLSGGTLTSSASCTVSVNITGTTAGVKNNSVQVTSTEGGTGNTSNASITVIGPPVIIKAFGAAGIPLNGSTSLSFTIQNNNTTTTLTGIGFSDTFPAGLVISTPNGLTGTCGGGTITATQATNVVSLSGASLAASTSCTFSVNVTGTAAGTQNNTTGNVTSTEGGTGGTASASVSVEGPPSIAKAFTPAAIAVNGTSALTLTITNPASNAVALTGVAVTDNLPAGLVVATPNGLTNTCGGTATATAGSGSISLTGGTIATSSSCALTVNVTASAAGSYINTTGAVSSANGGTGNTATATLTVQPADLTITKVHNGTFTRGQTGATYTITVNNIGLGPTTGTVTVVDTLPNVVNTIVPTALSGTGWTCTLGTLTCTRSDALAPGASYPAITLTVNIPINIKNTFTNTVTVSGGGETNTGNDTGSDTVTLGPPIIITPLTGSATIPAGGSAVFGLQVDSPDPTLGIITFSCSGLPAQAACTFSPATIDTSLGVTPATVTMTISTTATHTALMTRPPTPGAVPEGKAPIYATLLFPVLGLVGLGAMGRKNRKARIKMALCLAFLLVLLAMIGCGVAPQTHTVPGTPAGTSTVTITAASPGFTATSTVSLTVQ